MNSEIWTLKKDEVRGGERAQRRTQQSSLATVRQERHTAGRGAVRYQILRAEYYSYS